MTFTMIDIAENPRDNTLGARRTPRSGGEFQVQSVLPDCAKLAP
jgi:hypothetical protein